MTRQRARTTSQVLAATVTLAVVLIMLSLLRRGPAENPSRQAGWLPLLNRGAMADTAAFRPLRSSPSQFTASAQPFSRKPSAGTAP
jgi:hypothetical protein